MKISEVIAPQGALLNKEMLLKFIEEIVQIQTEINRENITGYKRT